MIVTLQLSTQADIGSKFIRYMTDSDFSHVDLVLPDGSLLGARTDGGVKIRKAGYAKFSKIAIYQADVPDEVGAKIYEFARAQVGKKYDKTGIVNFFIQNRNWRETDSWFCSELAAAAFAQAGWHLFNPEVSIGRITPRDITLSFRLTLKVA
jgi:uncharacterized protein YycO